jgi:hypothetical protein
MSGAAAAREAIHLAATAGYGPVHRAGKTYATAYSQAIGATDLMDALGCAVHLIQAAAHLRDVADRAEKDARAALLRTMEETGCTNIAAGTLTAYLSKRGAYVVIDPKAVIPPQFIHHPAPIPDKAALKRAIEGGETIPGVSVIHPNDQQLSIRSTAR